MTPQFRITVTLEESLYMDIAELAVKDNRKIASMAAILLQQAIKERNRKKNAKAKDESNERSDN